MSEPQKVIVYRSRLEQQNDEFWADHPEIALGIAGVMVLTVVVFWLYSLWDDTRKKGRWK